MLVHATAGGAAVYGGVGDVFTRVSAGEIAPTTNQHFPISRVGDAFSELEGRRTTGKVLLLLRQRPAS